MNKLLPMLAFLLATPIFAAEEATQIEVVTRYEGIDPEYVQFMKPRDQDKSQTQFVLPKITIRSGKKGVVRVVREHLTHPGKGTDLGTTLEIEATIDGNQIKAIGYNSFCTLVSPDKKSEQIQSFRILDTYFNQTFPNNKEVAIKLADDSPGMLYLTFTLMNDKGLPVK